MSDWCSTVCVWDRGGVHEAEDTGALSCDIAEALGAPSEAVKVTEVDQTDGGAWLTVRVFAPAVEKNWGAS